MPPGVESLRIRRKVGRIRNYALKGRKTRPLQMAYAAARERCAPGLLVCQDGCSSFCDSKYSVYPETSMAGT